MKKKMILVDGHGLAFRAFYALPEILSASDGTPTNAVLGFSNMLLKCIDEWKPDGFALFFDPKGPTKRHEFFKEYKEGRKPTPESFKKQLPIIIELARAMGIPVFIRDGVEADDYILATAEKAREEGWSVKILSGDKDLFQVIDEDILVVRPIKGISEFHEYDDAEFEKEFGFKPPLMVDYLALVGDAVDNIHGVPGIGEKIAKELIGTYGSLEKIYEHLEEQPKARRTKLEENKELAFMSRSLIVPQATEPAAVEELRIGEPDRQFLKTELTRLGLKKLLRRFAEGEAAAEVPARSTAKITTQKPADSSDFEMPAETKKIFQKPLGEVLSEGELALTTGETPGKFVLFNRDGGFAELDINNPEAKKSWEKWCESGTLTLYGLRTLLEENDMALPRDERINDVEVAHYILHPDRGGANISKTIGRPLSGGPALGAELFELYGFFEEQLKEKELEGLMRELDLPLGRTLAELKKNGISANEKELLALEKELEENLQETEKTLTASVGEEINLNSPKQISWLLFEHLNLPPIKKTKTGYSTDANVLEELAKLPEPLCDVPNMILSHRERSKILGGFVQPFLKLLKNGDGKIHSTFDHLATGTGRLASREPNVQNLPLFGEWATKFRSCFVPSAEKNIFVAADYSQIELRVLAHLSGEEKLIEAFSAGRDVHMETASWVFDLPPEDITPEQRRFAKVVNFGLLYGMGAHGLAQRLGIQRPTAAKMVDKYFSVFPGVKSYLQKSMKEAKEAGFTRSIFGRIRPLNEVSTIEGRGPSSIDRVAVNTPIQSAASDIAKIALMKFNDAAGKLNGTSVVLQIHDSIICECPEHEADIVEKKLIETMESVNVLIVPVKAEAKRGKSLAEV